MTPMPNHCNECDKPVVDWDEHARICEEFSSEEANQLLGFLKNMVQLEVLLVVSQHIMEMEHNQPLK